MVSKRDAAPEILLVEDDQDSAEMLQYFFETHGFAIVWAGTGKRALELMRARAISGSLPQLILLDLTLPDYDGTDLIRSMWRLGTKLPPVIVASARPDDELGRAAAEIEAAAIAPKPFSLQTLLATIQTLIGEQRPRARFAETHC
jgi:DNA-binding response OmpR family regulator